MAADVFGAPLRSSVAAGGTLPPAEGDLPELAAAPAAADYNMDYHDSDVLVEDGFNYDFDEEDELVQLYATGPRGGRRLGRNGPRTEEVTTSWRCRTPESDFPGIRRTQESGFAPLRR